VAYNIAIENYNLNLRKHFQNRNEPFEVEELFAILRDVRSTAVEEFGISADVREKYTNYETFLSQMKEIIDKQELTIININEGLAEKLNHQKERSVSL